MVGGLAYYGLRKQELNGVTSLLLNYMLSCKCNGGSRPSRTKFRHVIAERHNKLSLPSADNALGSCRFPTSKKWNAQAYENRHWHHPSMYKEDQCRFQENMVIGDDWRLFFSTYKCRIGV